MNSSEHSLNSKNAGYWKGGRHVLRDDTFPGRELKKVEIHKNNVSEQYIFQ